VIARLGFDGEGGPVRPLVKHPDHARFGAGEHLSAHSLPLLGEFRTSMAPAGGIVGRTLWAVWPMAYQADGRGFAKPGIQFPHWAGAVRSDASESLSDASISGSGARDAEPKNISS